MDIYQQRAWHQVERIKAKLGAIVPSDRQRFGLITSLLEAQWKLTKAMSHPPLDTASNNAAQM